jgi:hypothetical protein
MSRRLELKMPKLWFARRQSPPDTHVVASHCGRAIRQCMGQSRVQPERVRDADAAGDSGYDGADYGRWSGSRGGRGCWGIWECGGDSAVYGLWRDGEDDEVCAVQSRGVLRKGASEGGLEGA